MPSASERFDLALKEANEEIGKANRRLTGKELKIAIAKQLIRVLKVWEQKKQREHYKEKKENFLKRFLEELVSALLR